MRKSLGIARPLAWLALVFVVIMTVGLSTYIGNLARTTLLSKQHDFASLLAENLNHQVYRRFTLPTMLGFGKIALRQTAQYERLDQVIQSTIHGLNLNNLRIFGYDNTITYSTNREELGSTSLASPDIAAASVATTPQFSLISTVPFWQAFFTYPIEPNTFVLRTTYPLRMDNRLNSSDEEGPIMGVLEFSQDVTGDVESSFRFQQLVVVVTLFAACIFFLLLLIVIRRAEKAMAQRVQQEQKLLLELHQSEKLAGMGRVVASIAHEIRNPLGIIRSSAELLLKRNAGADVMTGKILQAVYDEAKRLSQTVSDFLDYAKPRQPRADNIDVGSNILKAVTFLDQELTSRQIEVVLGEGVEDTVFVVGDSDLLYRAFYNIMSNAIQAMDTKGKLFINRTIIAGTPPLLSIEFKDTGPGFPPDNIEKLLDPFFTTKDDGTGLGLPIVQNIIAGHNGTLHLSNNPEGGACLTVIMPITTVEKKRAE